MGWYFVYGFVQTSALEHVYSVMLQVFVEVLLVHYFNLNRYTRLVLSP